MSVETIIRDTLTALVGGRVHPDVTPPTPMFPCIVYQQVGGEAFDYLEGKVPDKANARIQVWVWSRSRMECSEIARSARLLLVEGAIKARTLGAPVSDYNEPMKLYGCRCDYSIWHLP